MTRGIDNIYAMVFPVSGGGGGGNRNTSFLLLLHPVHRSGTFVSLADFMHSSRVEKNTFGGGGLSGIDVSHDTYISYFFKCNFSWHNQD